jgi:hypothetical protein
VKTERRYSPGGAALVFGVGVPPVSVARLVGPPWGPTYPAASRRIDGGGMVIAEATVTVKFDGEPVALGAASVALGLGRSPSASSSARR